MPSSPEVKRLREYEKYHSDPEYRARQLAARKQRQKNYRAKNLERLRAYDKEYRSRPEVIERNRASDRARAEARRRSSPAEWKRTQWASRLRTKFGVTVDQYEHLYREQHGRCAICGGIGDGRALAVDHDHTTGAIRGLLCHRCNPAIGLLNDSEAVLRSAIDYLARHRRESAA